MKLKETNLLVIGLDGATFKIIKPEIITLPNFKSLMDTGFYLTLHQEQPLFSAGLWTTIFSGIPQKKHGCRHFVKGGRLLNRDDIPVRFVWDELCLSRKVSVLQVPITCPPYNFNSNFRPINNGLSVELNDLAVDTDKLTLQTLRILKKGYDLVITVFTALDRIQHFHWGEDVVLAWYKKIDQVIGILSRHTRKIIIVSDHGFSDFRKGEPRTLPRFNVFGQRLKGDHDPEAIFIASGIKGRINKPEQIRALIIKEVI